MSGCLVAAVGPLLCAESVDVLCHDSRVDGRVALVVNDDLDRLGWAAAVVHDYGGMSLVRVADEFSNESGARIHLLPPQDLISFRGWSGSPGLVADSAATPDGVLIVGLIGPMDRTWRARL